MAQGAEAEANVLKDQANAEFQKQQFLKAAALYTKAIKLDPLNAVLYSNRSTALLRLKKVGKALEDAEECLRLKPEWEKGYIRKAAVCEEQGQAEEALELYQVALAKSPEGSNTRELNLKLAKLSKLLGRKWEMPKEVGGAAKADAAASSASKAPVQARQEAAASSSSAPPAPVPSATMQQQQQQQQQVASEKQLDEDIGSPEIVAFLKEHMEHVAAELQDPSSLMAPAVHFLPGSPSESFEEQECHIRGAAAFDSPETLTGFVEFVRSIGQKLDAQAVLSVTPRSAVAYPKTWSKPSWPCGPGDGIMFQLEVRLPTRMKRLFFLPTETTTASQGQLFGLDPDVFALLPNLLR